MLTRIESADTLRQYEESSMDVSGPLKIGVGEPSAQGNHELHIDFDEAFKAGDLATQGEQFSAYLASLGAALARGELAHLIH